MAWEQWKTSSSESKLLAAVGSVIWLGLLLAAARFLDLGEPYLPFAIAGGLIFFLRTGPKVPEIILWLLCSVGFTEVVRLPHSENWIITASSVLALGGFAGFLMLGLRWTWSDTSNRRQSWAMLAPAAGMVFFVFS